MSDRTGTEVARPIRILNGWVALGCKLLGIGALLATAFVLGRSLPTGSDEPTHAQPAQGEASIFCSGVVDVESGVLAINSVQAGRVIQVATENEHVSAGAVLLRLDAKRARLVVEEAQAAFSAAQTRLDQSRILGRQYQLKLEQQAALVDATRARLESARQTLARKQELKRQQLIDGLELSTAEHLVCEQEAIERAERRKLAELRLHDPGLEVRQSEAQVELASARLKQAEQALSECALQATFAGTVLRVLTSPGEVLGGTDRPALMFCPDAPRIVRAEVEQEFAEYLEVGQSAIIQEDMLPGKRWHGRVYRIADWYAQRRPSLAEPARFQDVRTLECLIALDQEPPLRIGQRVQVQIVSERRSLP
ncbi:MAG: HlyD family secretion protein [Gemmataceae bacterium]